jgi:hypothetical protein
MKVPAKSARANHKKKNDEMDNSASSAIELFQSRLSSPEVRGSVAAARIMVKENARI